MHQKVCTKEDMFYARLNETFLIIEPFLNKNGFRYTMRHFDPSSDHNPNYVSIISDRAASPWVMSLVITEETLLVAKTPGGIYRVFDLHHPSSLPGILAFLNKEDPSRTPAFSARK